jgi:hypothetical protein
VDYGAIVLVALGAGAVAGGLAAGWRLRGLAAGEAERAHGLAVQLAQLVREGLEAQLRDRSERLAEAERLDAGRVAELARLRLALGAGGGADGAAADGVLLDIGPTAGDPAPGAPDVAGGVSA